jgi:hypothetical protein
MTAAIQRLLPIIIGGIGATGQALILFHLLADCYPYKMMSQPPSEFYLVIACVGGLASPIAAITAARSLCAKFKVISALPAVAALLSPLLFLFIFVVAHLVAGVEMGASGNFDRTTPLDAAYEFVRSGLQLIAAGVGIGALCGIAVKALSSLSRRGAQV